MLRDDLDRQWDVIYQMALYLFEPEMDDVLSIELDTEFVDTITTYDAGMLFRFERWLYDPPPQDAKLASDVRAFLAIHRAQPELGDPDDDEDPLYQLVTNVSLYDVFAYDLDREALRDPLLLQSRGLYFEQVVTVVGEDDTYDDDTAPFPGMPDAQEAVRALQDITIDNDLTKSAVEGARKKVARRYSTGSGRLQGRFNFDYDTEDVLIGFTFTYGKRMQLNAFMQRDSLRDYIAFDVEGAPPRVVYRDLPDGFYVVELAPHHLRNESRKLGNCIGQLKMGYAERIKDGRVRMFSLRTAEGRPKFNIEYTPEKGAVTQVKGKADRLPKKPYELAMLAKFIEDYLDDDPRDVTDMKAYRPGKYDTPARWNPEPSRRPRPRYSLLEPWSPREW